MNDLVIRDALIVDGSGSEPATGDVAVCDGAITAVGEHETAQRIDLHRLQSDAVMWKILHLVTAACKSQPTSEVIAPGVVGAGNRLAHVALALQ